MLSFGQFSGDELALINDRLEVFRLAKNSDLVSNDTVCRYFYFVNEGSFRHFETDHNGDERVLNLFTEHEWMYDYRSFISQQPANACLRAMEDSVVLGLSVHAFHELIRISDAYFRLGQILRLAVENQDYRNSRLTPEEKYVLLMQGKPGIIRRFPLKMIASYLGIPPKRSAGCGVSSFLDCDQVRSSTM